MLNDSYSIRIAKANPSEVTLYEIYPSSEGTHVILRQMGRHGVALDAVPSTIKSEMWSTKGRPCSLIDSSEDLQAPDMVSSKWSLLTNLTALVNRVKRTILQRRNGQLIKIQAVCIVSSSFLLAKVTQVMTVDDFTVEVEGVSYTSKELHRQYAPNLWTRHGRPSKGEEVELITRHYRQSLNGTKDVRTKLKCTLDYPYGSASSQLLDIYGTDLPANAPVFFFVHGGGWQFGSKDLSGFFASNFYSWGCKTIIFGYSLAPTATLTDMVNELKAGLTVACKLYPKSNFIIGGHSAGAQLVSCVLHDLEFNASQIKRVLLLSGIYDLRMFAKTVYNSQIGMTREEVMKFSSPLQTQVNPAFKKSAVKILVIVGKYESSEFKRQAKICHENLIKLGLDSSLWESEEDDHFTVIEALTDSSAGLTKRIHEFVLDLTEKKQWLRLCHL